METILETSGGSRDAKWIFVLSTSRNLYVDQKLCRWILWLLVAIYMEFIFFARCEGACFDRNLHGVFEAASSGQNSIDPYAWTETFIAFFHGLSLFKVCIAKILSSK